MEKEWLARTTFMKDLLLPANVDVRTSKFENVTSSFARLRQSNVLNCVQHVQHDYLSSFNQSNHWFVALSLHVQGNYPTTLQRIRHRVILDGHPSSYPPRPTGLNFSEQAGTHIPLRCEPCFMHAKWQCHAHYPDKTTHHLMLPLGRQFQAIRSFFALIIVITLIFRIFTVAGDFLILFLIVTFVITPLSSALVACAWMQNVCSFWVLFKQCFLYPK